MNNLIKVGLAVVCSVAVSTVLSGCASSPVSLPEEVIVKHKGDTEGLYDAWISPLLTRNNGEEPYIKHNHYYDQNYSDMKIKNGFKRFCEYSGGVADIKEIKYGYLSKCLTKSGDFISEIKTTRYKSNKLRVYIDTAEWRERRALIKREFDKRASSNGPTGVIATEDGVFDFIRIGNLDERHVLRVNEFEKSGVYVESISRIDFSKGSSDVTVTLRDGRQKTLYEGKINRQTGVNSSSGYGGGKFGIPVVVIDPKSGQPYTRKFSIQEGIKYIQFESDTSVWKYKPGKRIRTLFDPIDKNKMTSYVADLRTKANALYDEAKRKDWLKLLPDGNKSLSDGNLPRSLSNSVEYRLDLYRKAFDCDQDVASGIYNFEPLLKCKVASREYRIIIRDGYSLNTKITPMASIIALNQLKSDLD